MENAVSGKVREVYTLDAKELVIVTSDRISAFDVILPKTVKGKGEVLNSVSNFWFDRTKDIVPNHIISTDETDLPKFFRNEEFTGRCVLVKKLNMLPFEFIVRGYMFGTMWEAYKTGGELSGIKFKGDFEQAQILPEPILTPSTKASEGHDIYVPFTAVSHELTKKTAEKIRAIAIDLYKSCRDYALTKGIIIADTKFEFGLDENGNLTLADEIFTPDSSRFWNAADYKVGESPKSYDKQFLRDWLLNHKSDDGEMRFNAIPESVYRKTSEIYQECKERLLS
ncbi:phosphoribosylaminoimidazole-succinocarboxamide synthase [Clostridia bacterium]|nr:phosphoribosylaminoimidazole-succinocarboxamide synthase [Clostridia bacterium]